MGFPKRRFTGYEEIPWSAITNKQMVDHELDTKILNNILVAHAQSMRITGHSLLNAPIDGDTADKVFTVSPGNSKTILKLPLKQLMTGSGRIVNVWVMCSRQTASSSYIWAQIGNSWSKVYITAAAGTVAWLKIPVDVEQVRSPLLYNDMQLEVWAGVDWDFAGTDEDITVRSVSIHERWDDTARPWIDTTVANNVLGVDDYPKSAAMERIYVEKISAVHGHRMPRCNIFNRCIRVANSTCGAAFSASEDAAGTWMIRKPQGTTQIDGKAYAYGHTPNGGITVRVGLWSPDSLAYNGQTVNYTVGKRIWGVTSGATARIVADNDAGATGTLSLCDVDGTFQNGETIKDEDGGTALANGTNAGPVQVAYDDQNAPTIGVGTNQWLDFAVTGLIDEEAEFEVRLDAKRNGGAATVALISSILLAEDLGTAVTHVLPNPVNTEQDDDVLAMTWQRAKETLDDLWAMKKQILLQDYRHTEGGQVTAKSATYGQDRFDRELGFWGMGPVFPSAGAKVLHCTAWVSRPSNEYMFQIDVNTMVAAYAIGDLITGSTSGATATLENWDITAGVGTITFSATSGSFQSGENISFASGGSATTTTTMYRFEADVKARLSTAVAADIEEHEINLSHLSRNQIHRIDFRVPISPAYENDMSTILAAATYNPYQWKLEAITDNTADFLILEKYICFEEVLLPSGWDITQEDT